MDAIFPAVLIVDRNGRVEYANSRAILLFAPAVSVGMTVNCLAEASGLSIPCLVKNLGMLEGAAIRALPLDNGRTFDCSTVSMPEGRRVITILDMTAYAENSKSALIDPLTGLHNRVAFQRRLSATLGDRRHNGTSSAIHCLDLDRFKSINDTLGHPVGDLLLQKVAQRLRSAVREEDVVARLGGDEFVVLQKNAADPGAAEALAARLVELIGRTYVLGGHVLNIGASVGVTMSPANGLDPDVLLKQADLALYRAKVEGRGTHRFFEPAMDAKIQARRLLEIDLRRALALKEFSLAYQPQVLVATGEIVGFEALLRWTHAERGTVSPADYIPLAEEIGIINQIGDWVVRTACREAAGWTRSLSIAVNISPLQFRGGKLVETVASALDKSGLDPTRLELEITEGALLEDTANVLGALNSLRALGVKISMDDFGTGYSSLSYLQKFPFTKIKIDQSFVSGSDTGASSNAIIRAVSNLGISLGMRTVAEGVETEEQLACIRAEGCLEVQGYLTGRPVPAASIPALIDAQP